MWTTEGIGLDYTGKRLYGFTALELYGKPMDPSDPAVKSLHRIAVCPSHSCTMPVMTLRKLDPRFAVALWIGLIYATIPLVRRMREAFAARWPVELIAYAVVAVVVGTATAAVIILRRRRSHIGLADLLWLTLVAAVVIVWTRRLMGQPEETIHFLEYGVLGVLLFRALEDRVPDPTIYVVATLAGLLAGTVDEFIQWLVPGRYWDIRDIVLNGGAVALVQIVLWRLVERPTKPIPRSSLRLVCRLAAAQVLLFTLCMAATPQRLNRLADHLPVPDRLATGVDAICEYGYRHRVDDRTVFRSRLPSAELLRSDRERAPELDALQSRGGIVQSEVSPTSDPFGYEFRVHLFARNRGLNEALEHEPGSSVHRRHMTTAWRENLILEKFFASTLEQSAFRWAPERRNAVEAAQDPDVFFLSRAGAHLITRVSEGRLRALLLALFAALVACDVFCSSRSRPGSPTE